MLTNTEKQRIFGIAIGFRDTAMQELRHRFGSWIDDERNGALASVWTAVKFFLRFDGETGEAKIGPRAAESLVRNAMPWVTEQVINTTCFIVEADPYELAQGYCVRRINYRWCPRCGRNGEFPCPTCDGKGYFPAQEREPDILVLTEPDLAPVVQEYKGEPCQNCKGTGRLDCDCEDDYQYSIPTGTKPGSVLEGTGLRTGNQSYAILSPPVYTPRPQYTLGLLYQSSNGVQNPGSRDDPLTDPTFEEVLKVSHKSHYAPVVSVLGAGAFVGAIVGYFMGISGGALIGSACVLPVLAMLILTEKRDVAKWGRICAVGLAAVSCLLIGAALGKLTGALRAGLVVSGVVTAVLLGLILISWKT